MLTADLIKQKAKELGVKIISEDELVEMIK